MIRERIAEGIIAVDYISTTENIADLLTKNLSKPKAARLVENYMT